MVILGKVENGVVVIEGDLVLPEGAEVSVSYPPAGLASETCTRPATNGEQRRVRLPLVPSTAPGTRRLTADEIAEILDQEDASPGY